MILYVVPRREEYSNQWVIKVPGGEEVAQQVADDHGYQFVGKVKKNKAIGLIYKGGSSPNE